MLGLMRQYGFILGLIAVIALAVWHAQSSANLSILSESTKWSLIAVIFAFQGLGLTKEALSKSYKPIRLPLFVLFWNFLGFPLVVMVTIFWWVSPILQTGFFFLSIVPTTIALSVAYTDLSGGRVEGALFSTCVSNLIGALLVPLAFIALFGIEATWQGQLMQMVEKIVFMLILPILIGYALRRYLPMIASCLLLIKKQSVEILLLILIYSAFVDCFCQGLASELFLNDFITCLGLSLLLFLGISALVWKSSHFIGLSRESQIAAFFTASHKSICSGVPLILLTIGSLGDASMQAMVLLPLIAYYFFQASLGAYMTHRFKQTS
ncbi:MAG: bile acid:sodium symporter [Opitutae bacterium]|nr:bile acid:sodium symporter [Opitutae bacterium]